MARAINVSPVGVKIELFSEIYSEKIRLITVDSDDKLIQIDGRIVHSNRLEDGRLEIGICFSGTEADRTRFALKIIGHCHQTEPDLIMLRGAERRRRDRRRYPRVDANNLVSYCCLDEDGKDLDLCMARALDVNPLGAKIETYQEILSETIHMTTVDADDNLIEIMGKVVHTHKADDGRYEFGIQFIGTEAENTDFALKVIGVCHKIDPSFIMVKKA
jgi:c-di-GMP-binding flagellar brake protein YcgR